MQDIHSRSDPRRETIVTILGLIEPRGLLPEHGEDSFGGITGLKAGKERMLGEVLLSRTLVFFQSRVENGGKVRMGGRCGWDSGHGVPAEKRGKGIVGDVGLILYEGRTSIDE